MSRLTPQQERNATVATALGVVFMVAMLAAIAYLNLPPEPSTVPHK